MMNDEEFEAKDLLYTQRLMSNVERGEALLKTQKRFIAGTSVGVGVNGGLWVFAGQVNSPWLFVFTTFATLAAAIWTVLMTIALSDPAMKSKMRRDKRLLREWTFFTDDMKRRQLSSWNPSNTPEYGD